jgi:hypothetical protein
MLSGVGKPCTRGAHPSPARRARLQGSTGASSPGGSSTGGSPPGSTYDVGMSEAITRMTNGLPERTERTSLHLHNHLM